MSESGRVQRACGNPGFELAWVGIHGSRAKSVYALPQSAPRPTDAGGRERAEGAETGPRGDKADKHLSHEPHRQCTVVAAKQIIACSGTCNSSSHRQGTQQKKQAAGPLLMGILEGLAAAESRSGQVNLNEHIGQT